MSLLNVKNLRVSFDVRRAGKSSVLRAVDGVSFSVAPGEIVGLVGESGSGKSTLARAVLRITPIAGGTVTFDGHDITAIKGRALRDVRRDMQLVFQDPMASLNPRLTAGQTVEETLRAMEPDLSASDRRARAIAQLRQVGLPKSSVDRYPHEFSGGQRQRISIARAIVSRPKLLVCDESVSALDVSVQAQIVNLLKDLRDELGMAMLFISHDLAVIRHVCDRTLVLYYGKLAEVATNATLFETPAHPYTRALIDAIPRISDNNPLPPPREADMTGDPRDQTGCQYAPRCPHRYERCETEPPLMEAEMSRSACWLIDS